MNKIIKDHLKNHCIANERDTTDDDFVDVLVESENIYREEVCSHRWWGECFYVVEIDGMLIGYNYAEAKGDDRVFAFVYKFDFDSICEVETHEKTVGKYRKKIEKEES